MQQISIYFFNAAPLSPLSFLFVSHVSINNSFALIDEAEAFLGDLGEILPRVDLVSQQGRSHANTPTESASPRIGPGQHKTTNSAIRLRLRPRLRRIFPALAGQEHLAFLQRHLVLHVKIPVQDRCLGGLSAD